MVEEVRVVEADGFSSMNAFLLQPAVAWTRLVQEYVPCAEIVLELAVLTVEVGAHGRR